MAAGRIPVRIAAALRTPAGRFGGRLRGLGAVELAAAVMRPAAGGAPLAEVILSLSRDEGLGSNPARQAQLMAGLDPATPAYTVNMASGGGLLALVLGARAVRETGRAVLVAGAESMSNIPHVVRGLRWSGRRRGDVVAEDAWDIAGRDLATGLPFGALMDRVAAREGITRAEQDEAALASQGRAGREDFRAEIVPVEGLDRDETIRRTTLADLAALPPAFSPDGTVTAGNACAMADGAAALLLEPGEGPGLARVDSWALAGLDGESSFHGAARAAARLSASDVYEVNEAFAAKVVLSMRLLGVGADRVNPRGGAIALGHPIGASGVRMAVSLSHFLTRAGAGSGTLCCGIAGGQGAAVRLTAP